MSNRAGLDRYTWNLQYPERVHLPGHDSLAGIHRRTVRGAGHVHGAPDRRQQRAAHRKVRRQEGPADASATNADLAEQERFALQLRDRVTAANDAVKTIRNVKRQLEDRAAEDERQRRASARWRRSFEDQISNVEDSLYQTKNRSGEDPLNFPVRINNQMAALLGFVESGERRPPKQSYDVYAVLDPKLQTELTRYKRVMDESDEDQRGAESGGPAGDRPEHRRAAGGES